jgi:hypothetical protein
VDGGGDVQVDEPQLVRELRLGERAGDADARVDGEGLGRTAGGADGVVQLLDAVVGRQVDADRDDGGTGALQRAGRAGEFGVPSRDEQVRNPR